MQNLLNLLSAVALLVWGTHLVRAGILRIYGAKLRDVLSQSVNNRFTAVLAGLGVTGLVQSSTATAVIATSFAGRGLIATPSALATPSLAIACAAREALRLGDVIETMLKGVLTVLQTNDLALGKSLCAMEDTVDDLYTAIKLYLTQVSHEALGNAESRRWTDIVTFAINMEHVGDMLERILIDLEEKKIVKNRNFSEAGMAEICDLHQRLVANLQLGLSVFLEGDLKSAQRLIEQKTQFRNVEIAYADNHLRRLLDNTPQSVETSSLHLDLISDMKRINSHICSIAYPILEQAGVLNHSRLRETQLNVASGAVNGAPRGT